MSNTHSSPIKDPSYTTPEDMIHLDGLWPHRGAGKCSCLFESVAGGLRSAVGVGKIRWKCGYQTLVSAGRIQFSCQMLYVRCDSTDTMTRPVLPPFSSDENASGTRSMPSKTE